MILGAELFCIFFFVFIICSRLVLFVLPMLDLVLFYFFLYLFILGTMLFNVNLMLTVQLSFACSVI